MVGLGVTHLGFGGHFQCKQTNISGDSLLTVCFLVPFVCLLLLLLFFSLLVLVVRIMMKSRLTAKHPQKYSLAKSDDVQKDLLMLPDPPHPTQDDLIDNCWSQTGQIFMSDSSNKPGCLQEFFKVSKDFNN